MRNGLFTTVVAWVLADLPNYVQLLSLSQHGGKADPYYASDYGQKQYLLFVGSNTKEKLGMIGDVNHYLRVDRINDGHSFDTVDGTKSKSIYSKVIDPSFEGM
jgi:hypothetical protein